MRTLWLMVFCALLIAGCSQGAQNPTLPSNTNGVADLTPVIGLTDTGDGFTALGLMGVYELNVNPQTNDVSLVSKRLNTIGESYIVSGVAFWTIAPCTDCMTIKGYSLTPEDALAITFTMDHPFPAGDPLQPPTGKNRLDLDVFDLAALVVPVTGAATPTTFSQTGASAYSNIAFNADGYTTELKNLTGDAAAVPYFLVVDDSGMTTPTNNRFSMGTTGKEFDVLLNIAGGSVPAFDIYLTMGYGASAKKMQRLTPKYYIPEFNRKAAWKVEAIPPVGGWFDSDGSTLKTVQVKVYDWQQGAQVSTTVPYSDETDTTKVNFASDVTSVSVEIPGMNSTLQTLTTPTSGTGTAASPLLYDFPIANELLLPMGEYKSLVKVLDGRAPGIGSGSPGVVDTLVDAPDGIVQNWYDMPEFATYQTFTASVIRGCGPISGEILTPRLGNYETVYGYADGEGIAIDVQATSVGSTIALYEADYNYDGVTFVADASNATGIFTGLGPAVVPSPCTSNVPMTFQIAFRATDNCVPPNVEIFKIFTGVVQYCQFTTPVGNVTITVNRLATSNPQFDLYGTNGPWNLSWTGVGAAEYAVYQDLDPGAYLVGGWTVASLTDNLVFVGTTTTNSFAVPFLPIQTAKKYTPGTTYVVRGRSAVGKPSTECSTNSELAFIMTFGYETGGSGNCNPEGWTGFCYMNNAGTAYRMVTEAWNPFDAYAYRWGYMTTFNYTNYVAGSLHGTPLGIPNSQRRMDTGFRFYQFGTPGIFLVTSSAIPSPVYPVTTYPTFEWVQADGSPCYPYTGAATTYQATIASYGFVDVPTSGNVCWYTASSPNWQLVRCNYETGSGNPAHQYVGFIKVSTAGMTQDYPSVDDTAILIY